MTIDQSYIDRLLDRIIAAGLTNSRDDFVPCSEAEILEIERFHNVKLPEEYKNFLRIMGKKDGTLFESDHISALYSDLNDLGTHFSYEFYKHVPPKLKGDFFVFATRMGDYNLGFYMDGSDDPDIYGFDDDSTFEKVLDSIWDFIEGMVEYYE